MGTTSIPMSNIQLELLKIYATDISEHDLLEIKRYLAKFFMKKAIAAADQTWDEKGYTKDLMEKWLEE